MANLLGKLVGSALLGAAGAAVGWEAFQAKAEKPKGEAYASKGTKMDFLQKLKSAIAASGAAFTPDGTLLCVAWAAYETNWGRTSGYTGGNNAFNVTAGSTWKGPTVPGPDTEYDAQGNVKSITQAWRAYGSVTESVTDVLTLISQNRFGSAKSKLLSGDATFTDDLYAGKYFTLPPDKYRAGVALQLGTVRQLAQAPSGGK